MSEPIHVTDLSFKSEVLESEMPVLVDFWAVACAPCRTIDPIFDHLCREYAGRVKFARLNVEENMTTPAAFGVRGIPTVLAFKNGKITDQLVGAVQKKHFDAMIGGLV